MNSATTPVFMVVKHIRVNESNKKSWERKFRNDKKDWSSWIMVGLIVVVAAVGLWLVSGLA